MLAAEELIASKLFVIRRERFDGADIAHAIYGTRGKLDWQRILAWRGITGNSAMGACFVSICLSGTNSLCSSDVWNTLLERFAAAIANPDPQAKFRGSLVDDRMFAIDVNEWGLEDLFKNTAQAGCRHFARKCEFKVPGLGRNDEDENSSHRRFAFHGAEFFHSARSVEQSAGRRGRIPSRRRSNQFRKSRRRWNRC